MIPKEESISYEYKGNKIVVYNKWTQQILVQLRAMQTISIINDIAMGQDYLGTVLDRDIKPNDIVLMLSLDGAQLYESKQSNCWMYIWIIVNLSPNKHYHKIHV